MKRILLAVLALTFALSASAGDINKKVNVSSFDKIDISSFFKVNVVKAGRESLEITIDEELEPYLIAKVNGHTLYLGLDTERMPKRLRNNNSDRTLKAEIRMSSLVGLDISGAARFTTEDTFNEREFEGDFSGASKIDGLSIVAPEANFDISGASELYLTLKCSSKADFDISGASSIHLEGNIEFMESDVSGAASMKVTGTFGKLDMDASGASRISLKGTAKIGKYSASGASKVDAEDCIVESAYVDASGASNIYANVTGSISVELSGASSLNYTAPENVSLVVREISRGCSMRRR